MDILTLLISLALVGGTLALVLWPLWRQARPETSLRPESGGRTLAENEARYQATLDAIRDLMFDYEMGKVSAEDYERLLQKTKLEAAHIRRQIDQFDPLDAPLEPGLEAEIEARVAQVKQEPEFGDQALRHEVEAVIERLKTTTALTCPACGHTAQQGDAFCSRCGQALLVEARQDVCPECGAPFKAEDAFCVTCGAELQSQMATRKTEDIHQVEPVKGGAVTENHE